MRVIHFADFDYIPASHEDPKDPGAWKKILFKRDDLVDSRIQIINWAKLSVGKSFEPHYHEDMQEVFIIMSGKVEVTVGEETAILEKGDAVIVPIGKTHTMKNLIDTDVEYIAMGIALQKGGKTVNV